MAFCRVSGVSVDRDIFSSAFATVGTVGTRALSHKLRLKLQEAAGSLRKMLENVGTCAQSELLKVFFTAEFSKFLDMKKLHEVS